MVEVGSQVSGTIASLPADFNSRVKAGQVLARLDPASFHARPSRPRRGSPRPRPNALVVRQPWTTRAMKLEDADALAGDRQLARAELDLARTTMQQAAADVKGADADIAAARAAVTQAQVSLDRTVIRSPIDGVVIGRHVEVGQTIAASVNAPVLFTIGDLRRMRLLAEVPEGEGRRGAARIAGAVRDRVDWWSPVHGNGCGSASRTAGRGEHGVERGASSNVGTSATSTANAPVATSGSSPRGTSGSAQPAGSSAAQPRGPDVVSVAGTFDYVCQADSGHRRRSHLHCRDRRRCFERGHSAWRHRDRDAGRLRARPGRPNPEQRPDVRSVDRLVCRRRSGTAGPQSRGDGFDETNRDAAGLCLEIREQSLRADRAPDRDRGRILDRARIRRYPSRRSAGAAAPLKRLVSQSANCVHAALPISTSLTG